MSTNKLKTKFCDTAPVGTHFDGDGLYLLVKPNGKRYWRMACYLHGKRKLLAFGSYPKVTIEKARKARAAAQELISQGIDPVKHKQEKLFKSEQAIAKLAKEQGNTFEQIAKKLHDSKAGKVGEESRNKMLRQLEIHVFPTIGSKQIAEIEGAELLALFQEVSRKTNHERPMTYMARKLCQWSAEVFDFAHVLNQSFLKNPCRVVIKHLPKHSYKHMAKIRFNQLENFVKDLKNYKGYPSTKGAMWIMLYTGMRTASVRRALIKDFNLEEKIWYRQPEKTDKSVHPVPLPFQAINLIEQLLPHTGSKPDDLLFPSVRDQYHMMSEAAVCQALERMKYEMVGHGLRGVVSTGLNELGFKPHVIEAQLGHKPKGVEAAYNESTYLDERCIMMQKWADYIDSLLKKKKKAA